MKEGMRNWVPWPRSSAPLAKIKPPPRGSRSIGDMMAVEANKRIEQKMVLGYMLTDAFGIIGGLSFGNMAVWGFGG